MWIGLASIILNLGLLTVLSLTFFTAYFVGNMRVLVTINDFGEAHLEMVLIVVLYILLGLAMLCHIRKYKIRLKHS